MSSPRMPAGGPEIIIIGGEGNGGEQGEAYRPLR